MQVSFSLTNQAASEIKRLFLESGIEQSNFIIKVNSFREGDGSRCFELVAVEDKAEILNTDLVFSLESIEVVIPKSQINIFNGVQLDFKAPSGSDSPVFIFSKPTSN